MFKVSDGDFHKSIDSPYQGACVNVAIKPEGVAVRDTKDPDKNTLFFTREEWDAFLKGVRRGQFELN